MKDFVVTTKQRTGTENTGVTEEFLEGFRYDGGDEWFKFTDGSGGKDSKTVITQKVGFSQVPLEIRVRVYRRYEKNESVIVKTPK